MDLESEIDRLYQLPPDEFTTARNALAKTLAGGAAQQVKHLEKPVLAAWAVNQVHWQARPIFDALIETTERFRDVQRAVLEGRKGDVRKAQEAQRAALRAAVARVHAILKRAGLSSSPATLESIERTLDALPKKGEVPGRLSHALAPGGFELLAGLTPTAPPAREQPKAKQERPAASRARAARMQRALRQAEHAAKKADAALSVAMTRLDAARAEEVQLEAAVTKAAEKRAKIEGELEPLQRAAEQARTALAEARTSS